MEDQRFYEEIEVEEFYQDDLEDFDDDTKSFFEDADLLDEWAEFYVDEEEEE